MLEDLYGLVLTTASAAARDAYADGSGAALTFYPGSIEAYDRAIDLDPGFAMAHAGKAQILQRQGDTAAARQALGGAIALASSVSEREASHIALFDLVFSGQTEAALAAMYKHLAAWPRDALVVNTAANPNGLIGGSGHIGQKHQIAELMDSLAAHYGNDAWFVSYHAMALSEDGRPGPARAKIEQSIAANPKNAHCAHGLAHVCYESGDPEPARRFLAEWLRSYPRDGFFYGHLSWHLSLFEIVAGNWTEASLLYRDAIALDRHSGGPQQKISDGAAFLWRSELAGHPRDREAWRALHEFAKNALPRPGSGLADLHVILAEAVMGDAVSSDARARQIEALSMEGRYPSGTYLSMLAPGFAAFERGDFDAAIATLAPLAGKNERIGGSRAQHDLIDFTLLRSYIAAGRSDEARDLLGVRRPGASGIPVEGVAAVLRAG
jgi:tetratricopeptide (TPR) repeat protein